MEHTPRTPTTTVKETVLPHRERDLAKQFLVSTLSLLVLLRHSPHSDVASKTEYYFIFLTDLTKIQIYLRLNRE